MGSLFNKPLVVKPSKGILSATIKGVYFGFERQQFGKLPNKRSDLNTVEFERVLVAKIARNSVVGGVLGGVVWRLAIGHYAQPQPQAPDGDEAVFFQSKEELALRGS